MKKTFVIIVILVVIIVGIYLVTSNNKSNVTPVDTSQTTVPVTQSQTTTTTTSTTVTSNTSTAASVSVDIRNFSFSPATLTIKSGTKVTWVNNDTVAHTITSDSGNLLNSPVLSPGQSFDFTFTTVGSISYHCAIHPSMKGTIIVEK